MNISTIADALPESEITPQDGCSCSTGSFIPEPPIDKIPVRLKINATKASITTSHNERTFQQDSGQQQQIDADVAVEKAKDEPALVQLVPPATPITIFKACSRPPFEAKRDKEFVIYVPYTFEDLKPHFTSPTADAKQLFTALTGNKLPRSMSRTHSYGMWGISRTAVGPAYLAFMKDLDRDDILASRIPAADGSGKEWTRLEFGRDLWNMGQNYAVTVRKGMAEAKDSEKVKEVLAKEDTDDEHEDGDESGSDGDAMDLDKPDKNDSDGEWAPRRRKK